MTNKIHEIINGFDSSLTAMREMFTRQNGELRSAKALAIALETDCDELKRNLDRVTEERADSFSTIRRLEEEIATLEEQNTTANNHLDEQSQFHDDRRNVAMAARALRSQLDDIIGTIS